MKRIQAIHKAEGISNTSYEIVRGISEASNLQVKLNVFSPILEGIGMQSLILDREEARNFMRAFKSICPESWFS